jgi:hypothetical protein
VKFFIPNTPAAEAEATYQKMAQLLKLQFRLPILERRIFSLTYTNSKKNWFAEVGQMEDQQNLFQIAAIFESKTYIIVTKTSSGKDGLIIMVDKDEVTEVVEFDRVPTEAS